MPRIALLAALAALSLGACDQPAPRKPPPPRAPLAPLPSEAAAGPARERLDPLRWDEKGGVFTFNGQPLATFKAWTFDGTTDGFTLAGGDAALADPGGLKLVNIAPDPALRSPSGLAIDGARFPLVIVRLTRTRAGGVWDGSLHYKTPGHGEAETFSARPIQGADPAVNETTTMVYDLSQSPAAADWAASQIDQFRIDTDDLAGGEFLVRQVAVAARPPGMGPEAPPAPAAAAPAPPATPASSSSGQPSG